MHEMNPLEKQLKSWTPRRPSARLARRIFGQVAPAPALTRRVEFWNFLTPIAACVLTLLVTVHAVNRHATPANGSENASYYSKLMINPATSNSAQRVVFREPDENLEWNVWPHPFATQLVVLDGILTNH